MSKRRCCYKGCQGNLQGDSVSFFRFPVKDDDRCLEWILRSGNDDFQDLESSRLRDKRICQIHFADKAFQNALRKKLVHNAVPLMVDLVMEADGVREEIESSVMQLEKNSEEIPMMPTGIPESTEMTNVTATNAHDEDNNNIPKSTITENTNVTATNADDKHNNNIRHDRVVKTNNRLRKDLRNLKLRMLRKTSSDVGRVRRDIFPEIDRRLRGAPLVFVKSQLRAGQKVSKWSKEEKELGLAMFYRSPKLYKAMLKMNFKLPSVRTIRDWVNSLNVLPGISGDFMRKFGGAVRMMDRREKQCVLMFDEMRIKNWLNYNKKFDCVEGFEDLGELGRNEKSASHALVFMARGLTYKWKIPVAYYLSAGPVTAFKLAEIFNRVLEALSAIGLHVRAFVCDQGGPNQKLFRLLGISRENPFISVGGRKIYALFDVPHLIKSLRNNLMKNDFVTGDETISWKALQLLYKVDSQGVVRAAPNLSHKHVYPGPFDKMNVKLATQVFSHSVHAALLTLASTTSESRTRDELTALGDFIGKIDHVFDALNSRTLRDKNPYRRALNTTDTRSEQTLRDALDWLPHLHVLEPSVHDPPTFENLILSITSVLKLWEDLQSEGVKYLLTSRLQQDPVENLFSIIRQRVSYGTNPTATQFRQNLQHVIGNRLLIPPETANCEDDNDEMIISQPSAHSDGPHETMTFDVLTNEIDVDKTAGVEVEENSSMRIDDDRVEEVNCCHEIGTDRVISLEDNAVYYFSGFSVKKTLRKFDCGTCREILVDRRRESVARNQVLQFFKAYPTKNLAPLGNLVAASEQYWQIASHHLHLFQKFYPEVRYKHNVIRSLVNRIVDQDSKSQGWFDNDCREHRIFLLHSLLTSRLVKGLQWSSIEARESRKRSYSLSGHQYNSAVKKFRGN